MPTSRCTRTASARLLMRACARAPSAMLTTSTPPSLSIFAAAIARDGSSPTGGFTSTDTTKRLRAIFAARLLRWSNGTGCSAPGRIAGNDTGRVGARQLVVASRARPRSRQAPPCARRRRCASRARASSRSSRRRGARRRGSSAARRRRSTRASTRRPCARRRAAADRRSAPRARAGRAAPSSRPPRGRAIGPSEQFTPTMLAPHSFASRAISSALGPLGHASRLVERRRSPMTGTRPSGRFDRRLDRDAQLGRLADRLDEERVDAGIDQRARLRGERRLHLREVVGARPRPGSSRSARWRRRRTPAPPPPRARRARPPR